MKSATPESVSFASANLLLPVFSKIKRKWENCKIAKLSLINLNLHNLERKILLMKECIKTAKTPH